MINETLDSNCFILHLYFVLFYFASFKFDLFLTKHPNKRSFILKIQLQEMNKITNTTNYLRAILK